MINLTKDTISKEEIDNPIEWLGTYPRLTKGEKTLEFEKKWSEWLGVNYSVYVNSGSSANLAMIYALIQSGRLRNKNVIVPAVSWITTVSPVIQLGLNPILCECDEETLGIDINYFEDLVRKHRPSVLLIVHILGVPNEMKEIERICKENDIILLEDSCESVGSIYDGKKTGTFGLMSSFSCYYGHHFSTIEGGMVSTDDREMYNILKSIRSHSWDRDLDSDIRENLRREYQIDDFRGLYSFYYPGFNLRSTDLQAFIGLGQLDKLDETVRKRNENLLLYDKLIENIYWKLNIDREECYISNFAYPIITPLLGDLVYELRKNDVECRPLVCGSMGRQPFWKKEFGEYERFPFADEVHDFGLYLPNNHQMTKEEIEFICKIVNSVIG